MNKQNGTDFTILNSGIACMKSDSHTWDVNPHRNRKGEGLSNSEIDKTSDRSVSKLKGLDLDIDLLSNHSR